jgi:hypothetical protein
MNYGMFKDTLDKFLNRDDVAHVLPVFISQARLNLQRRALFSFALVRNNFVYPSERGVGIQLPPDFRALGEGWPVALVTEGRPFPLVKSSRPEVERRRHLRSGVEIMEELHLHQVPEFYLEAAEDSWFLFTEPELLEKSLEVRYYRWLPDYQSDVEEDRILREMHDILLYLAIVEANTYFAEDERIPINIGLLEQRIHEVVAGDGRVDLGGGPIDLA